MSRRRRGCDLCFGETPALLKLGAELVCLKCAAWTRYWQGLSPRDREAALKRIAQYAPGAYR